MTEINNTFHEKDRYARQILFKPIGFEGQKKISSSKVTLIGCGALGSVLAEMMVRCGVGLLRIVDRDFLELSNLQRQILFDEQDVRENLPKAEAAARKLRKINSQGIIEPIIADANHESVESFIADSDLILDGTDNLQTRFLINDTAVKHLIPWIYGACLGANGMGMVIKPGGRPCLRCVIESPPDPGQMETCETAGIIGPIVAMVAGFQAAEAIKLLTGNTDAVNRAFMTFDLWQNRFHQMSLGEINDGCTCCGDRNFEYLSGKYGLSTISLCGRNSVQVRPRDLGDKIELTELARRLIAAGEITQNEFMLRLQLPDREMTIFPDGRAIIKGTSNIDEARSLYGKYVGH
ncbi:MAG: ThiF family adenylyltransferase [Sedimentisphaerales bacterium]|nr:ThiF family adenylyltransferase [Sedimentisphaerales bacterium]